MQKDYRKALKYCKLSKLSAFHISSVLITYILQSHSMYLFSTVLDFEPNNITAKEFCPLIEERMRCKLESL